MPGTLIPGCGLPEVQLREAVPLTLLSELWSNGSVFRGDEAELPWCFRWSLT